MEQEDAKSENEVKAVNRAAMMNRGGRGRGMMRGMGRGRGRTMNADIRPPRMPEDKVYDRVQALQGPTHDIPPHVVSDKKFTNHCRLFVGNIPQDMKIEEFEEMFKKYGETAETFINTDKAFGFVKLDYRANAEKARNDLDGTMLKNRNLKIRFASQGTALKIKNLSQFVSNELLEKAFQVFGEVESAICNVDSKGKPTGEGKVEFASKPSAVLALKMCNEGCYFLCASPKPVIVEPLIEEDNTDGLSEKTIYKKNPQYVQEREVAPRFAAPGSFEFEYGQSWKGLFDLHRQKADSLESEMRYEKEKLEEQMEYAKYDHETTMLREELRKREMERERQMHEAKIRQQQREEQREREEEMFLKRQEQFQMRREEERKRRSTQETEAFTESDQSYHKVAEFGQGRSFGNGEMGSNMRGNMPLQDPKQFLESFNKQRESAGNYPADYQGGSFEQKGEHSSGSWGDREEFSSNKRRRWQ